MNYSEALEERLINFAVQVIKVLDKVPENRVTNHIANQLIRSSTSFALNYGEALAAESRRDFIHKLGIVLKELRESRNGLRILSKLLFIKVSDPSLHESNELISIFVTSIKTAKKNMEKRGEGKHGKETSKEGTKDRPSAQQDNDQTQDTD